MHKRVIAPSLLHVGYYLGATRPHPLHTCDKEMHTNPFKYVVVAAGWLPEGLW